MIPSHQAVPFETLVGISSHHLSYILKELDFVH